MTFASLTPNNLGTVRKLNSVLFPVRYSDKFYADILQPEVEDFCQLGAGLRSRPGYRADLFHSVLQRHPNWNNML